MVRLLLIAIPILVVITIYAVVDCAMLAKSRIRGLSRPAWIVLILVLPVVGLVLWFVIGRGPSGPVLRQTAPDDDPVFLSERDRADQDERIRQLEDQLRALDEEEQAAQDALNARGAAADAGGQNDAPRPQQDNDSEDSTLAQPDSEQADRSRRGDSAEDGTDQNNA
ncbi:MAG: PLDc N-terminal domain-containing protein [Mycetocola sp.]